MALVLNIIQKVHASKNLYIYKNMQLLHAEDYSCCKVDFERWLYNVVFIDCRIVLAVKRLILKYKDV